MDGYQKMFELMRRAGREGQPEGLRLRLGRVVSAAPLTVNVGGTEQEADRFTLTVNVSGGDRVLLLTEDDQTFHLIGRVVSG